MKIKRHAVMILATGGYIGRIGFAPGTFGSLAGIPIVMLLSCAPLAVHSAAVLFMIFGAVWVAHEAERSLNTKDPQYVVIDEIVGMCVTFWCVPITLLTCVLGFALFRFFDILKPPPVRQIDQRLPGGWGIVMDDVVAGIMANSVLQIGIRIAGS
ncbi:MAG: phosphatidylglycerophosphatase A [Desulfobacteraceae bacterium]|nr:phosphatidylglycerophosphatase A [Desulfobacteraceae bacterium]